MMLRHRVMIRATVILRPATPILLRIPRGAERSDWLWMLSTATGTRLITRLVRTMTW